MELIPFSFLLVSEIDGQKSSVSLSGRYGGSAQGFFIEYEEPEMPGVRTVLEGTKEKLVLRRSDGTLLRFLPGKEQRCRYTAGTLSGAVVVLTEKYGFSASPFSFEVIYRLDGKPCKVALRTTAEPL